LATLTQCLGLTRGLTREQYAARWVEKTRPYDGIPDLLDTLAIRGIRMAVLSNKPQEFTQLCVERLLSAWHFEAVLGALSSLPKKAGSGWGVANCPASSNGTDLGCLPRVLDTTFPL
jgi:phosphoglycolate phosphatase-like HAD superfamily hydrolase